MRIPCDHVAEELWDYLDDEIDDPVIRRRIDAHLEICARCFPEYDYRRSFLALLDRHAEDPIPPGLRRSVFEGLLAIDAGAD
jgi:anti-sigma factor (TIGR02949 family)